MPGFAMPPIRYVLAGLAVVAVVVVAGLMWPKGSGAIHGQVSIDGTPLPVGIVSITPRSGTKGPSLSIPVVDGRFETNTDVKLVEGAYNVSVTVGNPLGMPVPQLKGTPLDALNGSRFQTQVDTRLLKTLSIDLRFKATEVVVPKKKRRGK